jgi:hypothetical protein
MSNKNTVSEAEAFAAIIEIRDLVRGLGEHGKDSKTVVEPGGRPSKADAVEAMMAARGGWDFGGALKNLY